MKLMMMMMEGEWWGRRWVWGAVAAVECRNPEGCSLLTDWGTRAQRSLTDRNTEFRKLWNQTNKYLHRRWRKGLNLSGLFHLSMAHQCLRSWEPPGEAPAQRCYDLKLRPQSDWRWWLSHTQDHKPQTSVVSRVQHDHCGSAPRRKQRPAAPQHCSRRRRWWWRSLFSILFSIFLTTSSRVMWFDLAAFKVPEYEVEADDGLGLRRLAAVEDGRLRLGPDEAAAVRQEAVVSGVHLTFGQHYRETGQKTIWLWLCNTKTLMFNC